ncbi:MAG: Rieske 2Fe-2S domain-containing protein, partial [Actinobacteria bacterium]|nr:Rieske 2Fe-2S domain-containing protein [Actinomycetota bacterium]
VEDRCLHRGAALSDRTQCHSKNTVSCFLHGFTYDVRDGKLVQILSCPDTNPVGRVSLATYRVHEEFSSVWVYVGDGEPVSFAEDLPPFLRRAHDGALRMAFHPLVRAKINSNWRVAVENGNDPGHINIHRNAEIVRQGLFWMPLGLRPPRAGTQVHTYEEDGRFKGISVDIGSWSQVWEAEVEGVTVRAARQEITTEVVDIRQAGGFFEAPQSDEQGHFVLPCAFEGFGFPRAGWVPYEFYIPIDEHWHMYTIMFGKVVQSDKEEVKFHERAESFWGPLVWSHDPAKEGFNNGDAHGREAIHHAYAHEDWWHRERLYQPDVTIIRWRSVVERQARGIQRRDGRFAVRRAPEPVEISYRDEPGMSR